MKVKECRERLEDLKIALHSTRSVVCREGGAFFDDFILKSACKKYENRIQYLEELMFNGELDDSRKETIQ